MYSIKRVRPLQNYQVELVFNTDEVFIFDLKPYLEKGVFRSLKDQKNFKQVFVNPETKTLTWKNGIDFCADSLHEKLLKV